MKNLSRRSFLKGSAALGALAAMGGATLASADEAYTYADTIKWDAQYDVVVLGMGFAGMNAALAAADNGASVVICEKMNEALAGGNSKVCGQLFAYGNGDYESTLAYYKAMDGGRSIPEPMVETIARGVTNMWATIRDKFFNGDDSEFKDWSSTGIGYMSPEYPELPGSNKISLCTTHQKASDSFLFSTVKSTVTARSSEIDVWYESPAMELIQEPTTGTIIGVKVTRKGEERNVRALNGVVVATGGFEDDAEMMKQYANVINYAPMGGLFNTGDGIKMCQKAGAQLWHMTVYEGGFGLASTSFMVEEGKSAVRPCSHVYGNINTGALILVGTDGERFANESEMPRHGHLYENGVWENPKYPKSMWMVYDQTQADLIAEKNLIPDAFKGQILSAATIEELAEKTGMKPERIAHTIKAFNSFAQTGEDLKHGRAAEHMRAFDGKMYFAVPMRAAVLNTQGGPRRNENAEVLDAFGMPIPHLYSAGEMGGITACMYQGGTNVAECFTFGEIAGRNAAAAKKALPVYAAAEKVESTPLTLGMDSDIGAVKTYEAAAGQYVGVGKGMMGDVAVRVTMADGKISVVEVLEQNETPTIAGPALDTLPGKFVGCATAEEIDMVDGISGATLTSGALKEAVKNALAQVK